MVSECIKREHCLRWDNTVKEHLDNRKSKLVKFTPEKTPVSKYHFMFG